MVHKSDLIQGLEYPLVHTYPLNDSSSCVKFLKGVGEIFEKYSVNMKPFVIPSQNTQIDTLHIAQLPC